MSATPGRGRFFALEGLDGSGQTTQAKLLAEWLGATSAKAATYTKEPTDGPVGAMIRMSLKGRLIQRGNEHGTVGLDEVTMALCFAADRADHVNAEINPLLGAGVHVVSDRYYLSSLAYQSSKVDLGWLLEINRHALRPDLTIFLEVPAGECVRRIAESRHSQERYENLETLECAHQAFQRSIGRLRDRGDRVEVVNGCDSISEIHDAITRLARPLIAPTE